MKKYFVRIFCFIFSLIFFVSSIPFFASAASFNPMNTSDVETDLKNMNYDLGNYPRDSSANFISVIDFVECGYSEKRQFGYYGLYLYLYNPTGEEILPGQSYLQMAYRDKSGNFTSYKKFSVALMDVSDSETYDGLFYKFRVLFSLSLVHDLNAGLREYRLSSVELNYMGNIRDFPLGQSFAYTGYQENFEADPDKPKQLTCYRERIEVVQIEIHGANWFTKSSDLGEDYRYEVSSVYFNVPDYFLKEYGDFDKKGLYSGTSGLYAVRGVYDKFLVNGVITNSDDVYNSLKFAENVDCTNDDLSYTSWLPGFYLCDSYTPSSKLSYIDVDLYYNLYHQAEVTSLNGSLYFENTSDDFSLKKFLYLAKSDNFCLSTESFEDLYSKNQRKFVNGNGLVLGDRVSGLGVNQEYFISVDDGNLNDSIKSFASTRDDNFGTWLHRLFNGHLYDDEDGYEDIEPIIELEKGDFSDSKTDGDIADNLFVQVEDVEHLKEFYFDKEEENGVYLMRFNVNPYYAPAISVSDDPFIKDEVRSGNIDGYYFEKVIFENFDILEFEFRNRKNEAKTVPVACDPIDIIGPVGPGPDAGADLIDPDFNPNDPDGRGDDDDSMNWLMKLWNWFLDLKLGYKLLVIFGLLLGFALIWKLLDKLIGSLFRGLFGAVGGIVSGTGKLVTGVKDNRRRKREEKRSDNEDRRRENEDRRRENEERRRENEERRRENAEHRRKAERQAERDSAKKESEKSMKEAERQKEERYGNEK